MKWKNLIAALLIVVIPAISFAQPHGRAKGHYKHGDKQYRKEQKTYYNKTTKPYYGYSHRNAPPAWAPAHGYRAKQHVYFPDYYVFYDPYRGGYSYWQNNHWVFSQAAPSFLANINLGRARMQLLGDIPLTTHPENYYDRYVQMYPANSVNISIPIPGR